MTKANPPDVSQVEDRDDRIMGIRCAFCHREMTHRCDHVKDDGSKCDKRICDTHTQIIAPDDERCPEHRE